MEEINVKCYSGSSYADRPVSFFCQSTEHKVFQIEAEWREPDKKIFRIITEDEKLFELCYNEAHDKWWLIR